MFYSSRRRNLGASSFLIDSGNSHVECRGLPGGNSLFFCFAKSKVSKRKGDPQSGPLCGSLKKLKEPENLETSQLRCRRTSRFFIRLLQLFQAQLGRAFGDRFGVGFGFGPYPCPLPGGEGGRWGTSPTPSPHSFPPPVLAGLEIATATGLKNLDVRRLRSRLVSKFSGCCRNFKEPQSGPDCGSPFLLLTLLLAKQKKSELLPGNPRHSSQSTKSHHKCKPREVK